VAHKRKIDLIIKDESIDVHYSDNECKGMRGAESRVAANHYEYRMCGSQHEERGARATAKPPTEPSPPTNENEGSQTNHTSQRQNRGDAQRRERARRNEADRGAKKRIPTTLRNRRQIDMS
jgi:hypothetical protein